jgi:YidC/Oxa1 family membrane protein insertase
MINLSIMVSHYMWGSFGLTIILLTIVIRALMYPLTRRQLKASRAMQELQAQVAEIRKKYAKDRQKAAQEQMRLYKEAGVSPAGCVVPMLIQFPVWIALYQSIIRVLAVAPEDFLNLSKHLYSAWPLVFSEVPLESSFLWVDLAVPDRLLILPILVGSTMWISQKMMTPQTTDPKQQAQAQIMQWMLPLMFGFLSMTFPSGLALYWVVSSVIQIVMQYFATGWGGLVSPKAMLQTLTAARQETKGRAVQQKERSAQSDISIDDTEADIIIEGSAKKEEESYGEPGSKRQDSRGGYTKSPRATRRRSGGSGSQRRKRR